MPLDDESKQWKRREKTRRQYKLKNLPHSLDSSILDTELPDLDRTKGVGRVLEQLVRAAQGNFDHVGAEMKRFARLYNEGEADSHYMRELLDPHDHGGKMQDTVRPDDWDISGEGVGHPDNRGMLEQFKSGTIDYAMSGVVTNNQVRCMPVWVGSNSYADGVGIAEASASSQSVRLGIYESDGPGLLPKTLLVDAGTRAILGVPDSSYAQAPITISVDLRGGRWYWIAAAVEGIGSSPTWFGYTTEEDLTQNYPPTNSWWPFPSLDDSISETGILSYVFDHVEGPLEQVLDFSTVEYSFRAPNVWVRLG